MTRSGGARAPRVVAAVLGSTLLVGSVATGVGADSHTGTTTTTTTTTTTPTSTTSTTASTTTTTSTTQPTTTTTSTTQPTTTTTSTTQPTTTTTSTTTTTQPTTTTTTAPPAPCSRVQASPFTDDDGSVHEESISCAAAYAIVTGTTATTFDPSGNLTRGQAATVLVNYVERSLGSQLLIGTMPDFTDSGGVHSTNIEKAADNGIVQGFADGTFRPGALITREQFATIAVQATERVLGVRIGTDGVDSFDDVVGVHELNIEKAADNQILQGTGARTFSPTLHVSREQAATIVVRAVKNVLFPAGRFAG